MGENSTFAGEDVNELATDSLNGVHRETSSQENTGDLAAEVDGEANGEADGEVLFRFIGGIDSNRRGKNSGVVKWSSYQSHNLVIGGPNPSPASKDTNVVGFEPGVVPKLRVTMRLPDHHN